MIRTEIEFMQAARAVATLQEKLLRYEQEKHMLDHLSEKYGALQDAHDFISDEMDRYDLEVNPCQVGSWMPLFSGKRFWPEDPRPEDFDITDIAHALSNINRFNGHTKQAYNVAQHSVLVSRIVPAQYALHGLFHDASEALIQDFISPLKHLAMDWYGPLETKVMKAVCKKFDIDWNNDAAWIAVKKADNIMLATEVRDLTTCGFVTQRLTELPTEEHIRLCWSPECSEEMFRDRYREIILGTPKC